MNRNVLSALAIIGAGACDRETPLQTTTAVVPAYAIAAPAGYEAIDLGTLGGGATDARDLDDRSRVIGSSNGRAFFWEDGVMQELPSRGGDRAQRINNKGQVAGTALNDASILVWEDAQSDPSRLPSDRAFDGGGVVHISEQGNIVASLIDGPGMWALTWQDGVRHNLGSLNPIVRRTIASSGNERGKVVGWSLFGEVGPEEVDHPFVWEDGVMRDLGVLGGQPCRDDETLDCSGGHATDINDHGVIVGFSNNRAVRWVDGVIEALDVNSDFSEAHFINERGQIVGIAGSVVWLWDRGQVQQLGSLGGGYTYPAGLNDKGEIIGFSMNDAFEEHAFVWSGGQMVDLGPGRAVAINKGGDVLVQVGFSSDARAMLYRRSQGRT